MTWAGSGICSVLAASHMTYFSILYNTDVMDDSERSAVPKAHTGTAKGHEGVTESNFGGWGEYWIKSCCVVEVTYEMYHEV